MKKILIQMGVCAILAIPFLHAQEAQDLYLQPFTFALETLHGTADRCGSPRRLAERPDATYVRRHDRKP